MKINHFPNVDGIPLNGFSIEQGGTFGLEGITPEVLGKPKGVAVSTSLNLINPINLDTSFAVSSPGVDGPVTGVETKTATFTITNYNFNKTYTVTTNDGAVSIDRETVTFTPSHFGDTSFKINDRVINFPVQQLIVTKPSIIAPAVNTGLMNTVTVQSSAFDTGTFVDTHSSSDWQLSLVSDFSTILQSLSLSSTSKTTWNIVGLEMAKVYYVRVKHRGNLLAPSPWSEPYILYTSSFGQVKAPSVTSPLPNTQFTSNLGSFTATNFEVTGWVDTQLKSYWEISKLQDFSTVAFQTVKTVDFNTLSLPVLDFNTIYYLRVKYEGNLLGLSIWSSSFIFKSLPQPALTKPTIQLLNDPPYVGDTVSVSYFGDSGGSNTDYETTEIAMSPDPFTAAGPVKTAKLNLITDNAWGGYGKLALFLENVPLGWYSYYYVKVRHKGKISGFTPWSNFLMVHAHIAQPDTSGTSGSSTATGGTGTSTTPPATTTPTTTPGVVVPSTVPFYMSGGSSSVYKGNNDYETSIAMKYYTPTSGTKSYSYSYTYSGGSGSGGGSGPAGPSDTAHSNFMLIFSTTIPGRNVNITMDNGQTFNF